MHTLGIMEVKFYFIMILVFGTINWYRNGEMKNRENYASESKVIAEIGS